MGVEWAWVGVSGRRNIKPRNRWSDLDQIWHAGFTYARQCNRLCVYVMLAARGRGMGVDGRANIDLGNRWTDFDQI